MTEAGELGEDQRPVRPLDRLLLDVVEVVQPDADDLLRRADRGSWTAARDGPGLRASPNGAVYGARDLPSPIDVVVGGEDDRASNAVVGRELETPIPLEVAGSDQSPLDEDAEPLVPVLSIVIRVESHRTASIRTGWATRPDWPPGWSMARRSASSPANRPASRSGPSTARRPAWASAGRTAAPGCGAPPAC